MSGAEFRQEMAGRMKKVRSEEDPTHMTYVFNSNADEKYFSTTVANTIIMHRA